MKRLFALVLSAVLLISVNTCSLTATAETVTYTEIEEGIDFNIADGVIGESTDAYGLSEKIYVTGGDTFKVNCAETWQWGSKGVAAAYDSSDNFLGSFVHNIIYRGDQYMCYKGRGIIGDPISVKDSNGNNVKVSAYSLGLNYSSKGYETDVTFQIPDTSDEKSLFHNISYIRVRASKKQSADEFYVQYLGNSATNPDTGVSNLPSESVEGLSDTLGDLDGDKSVSIADVLYLKKFISKHSGYVADLGNADFNFDGKINLKDVAYLRRNLAEYEGYELKTNQKFIALSFDDAPAAMPIETCKKYSSYNVRGTYMLSATRMASEHDDKLKTLVELGYDFGNHTSFHNYLGGWAPSEIYNEVNWTQDLIYQKTGTSTKYFRPPYFTVSKYLSESLSEMVFIIGTSSSDTSSSVTAAQSAATQLSQAADGNIILLHDTSKLADTLDILIPALLDEGYVICTIDELFQYKNVTPQAGYKYTNVLNPIAVS